MKKVDIYTDGACSGNPGAGGYCAILIFNGIEKIVSGGEADTTNNRMELVAVIEGLKALKEPCEVDLYSDSQYVINAINEKWLDGWVQSGWRAESKKSVKNVDLWQALIPLIKKHKVNFIKVKGHSDNEYNNRCDKIAVGIYKNSNKTDNQ
ncbi:MAG: ribonuclease HI [Clostridia bacterium]|nr:ribonuclease HI [Clostridia bacterium]